LTGTGHEKGDAITDESAMHIHKFVRIAQPSLKKRPPEKKV